MRVLTLQEEGNVPFVVDNKLGRFERKPEKIARILEGWFGDTREEFLQFAEQARNFGARWRGALLRIVADLAEMCDEALDLKSMEAASARCC
jgi:1,2-diacylglycerol 3-beta-galactosyltransferase